MVDLAKIRKKAKKALAKAEGGGPSAEDRARSAEDRGAEAPQAAPVPVGPGSTPSAVTKTKLDRFKAEAGTRRNVAAAKSEELAPRAQLELLTFTIAGEQYAIDIEKIVEIVTPRPVTRIPNADPSVVGITSLRGTVVTLVDVRRKLRHTDVSEGGDAARIVVIDLRNETVGFLVDRVVRVVKIAPSEVEPHPVVHSTELEEAVRGVFRVSGALTILLDLDKLLDHSQWT